LPFTPTSFHQQAIAEEDVWAKHEIHKIPAERIIRHIYHPETHQWSTDETIVKIQKEPFTRGAMRVCCKSPDLLPCFNDER
jgi:elongation factor 2 kinase